MYGPVCLVKCRPILQTRHSQLILELCCLSNKLLDDLIKVGILRVHYPPNTLEKSFIVNMSKSLSQRLSDCHYGLVYLNFFSLHHIHILVSLQCATY